ncbi:MAG TPA: hypothetical protein VK694_04960 [Verrucomicrobiae bacterium]|nr:hypothetical protein [Verrucomicrobiae bacterium]
MFLVHRKVDIDERPTLLLEIGESVYYLEIKDVVFIKDSLVLAGGVRGIRRSMLDAPLSGFVLILGYNYQNVMTATLLGTSEIIDDESAYDRIRFIVDALF